MWGKQKNLKTQRGMIPYVIATGFTDTFSIIQICDSNISVCKGLTDDIFCRVFTDAVLRFSFNARNRERASELVPLALKDLTHLKIPFYTIVLFFPLLFVFIHACHKFSAFVTTPFPFASVIAMAGSSHFIHFHRFCCSLDVYRTYDYGVCAGL